ncbi:Protein of unknown function [Geoalkalibacter ferrihydriticus]|uniref:DUF3024 domain-containing protein n=2 Tax=Geoalkalibacter ferrihydriticus TaxID=392333 RepID=A0A0C2HFI4_9BACT|nr:DUF3024 domain-containing protein [Geoalkalibacter ferrihydriticus]KIH75676.1 hypothetical protein GFER_15230 [Geoalkalibacter ferrihydriticus DSM 17813]SDM73127.1 Protein of unknown function [Geoalkalibacter ferrihydriticus]
MEMPELVRKCAEKELFSYCETKVPPCFRNEVRVNFRIEGETATLYEERITLANPANWSWRPVAQFRFQIELNQWSLHYPVDRDSWRLYLNAGPTLNLKSLLRAVDDDPFNSFWQ